MIAIVLVAVFVLLVVVFRSRQLFIRANALLKGKNEAIGIQHKEIASQKQQIDHQMEELKMTQSQLVHSEKMASLGQLMAGIAHELNNPLNFISAGTQALHDHIAEIRNHNTSIEKESWQEVEDLFTAVLAGVDRATKIVHSLRTFSYENSEGVQEADLIECIEATLTMLQSELKNKIEVQKNYQPLPLVECNAGEISQVLMNILTNAIHAAGDKGTITITTGRLGKEDKIFFSIKDSGKGISDELIKRIFDPFFTTKPLGKGVGLGLSISYKIIENHRGSIEVRSKTGQGAEFIVTLPIHSPS
jgi:signal transduction histidine kinase